MGRLQLARVHRAALCIARDHAGRSDSRRTSPRPSQPQRAATTIQPPQVSLRDHPPYAAALDNLDRLKAQLADLQERHARSLNHTPPETLGYGLVVGVDDLPPEEQDETPEDPNELTRQIARVRAAIGKQTEVLGPLKREAAKRVVEQTTGDYARIAAALVDACDRIAKLRDAEFRFRYSFTIAGVDFAAYAKTFGLPPDVASSLKALAERGRSQGFGSNA